jgi:hypothetical protein
MKREDDPEEGPTNSPWGGPSRRGLKMRKRDDHGVILFRNALDRFADPARLRHALLELARAYDPLANGPILDPGARRRILELVEAGRDAEARTLLEDTLTTYVRRGEQDRSSP